MIHELKIWPEPFLAVWGGLKKFEYRQNDRNYKEGDFLHLKMWDNIGKRFLAQISESPKATA